jgi:curved DNA-binding protein CbpA
VEFKDYYQILEIDKTATQEVIKAGFKKQAIKWHPDRNLGFDTTEKMQEINEAYLILKDEQARERYDREYLRYQEFTQQSKTYHQEKTSQDYKQTHSENNCKKEKDNEPRYEFDDEILKKWMKNARRQAIDLAKQTILEVGELSLTATKAAGSKMLELFIHYAIAVILILIVVKTCSS